MLHYIITISYQQLFKLLHIKQTPGKNPDMNVPWYQSGQYTYPIHRK